MMPRLIVMCGLQGSGKSTQAKRFATMPNYVILSSDAIRKEFPEYDNNKVFEYLYKKMNEYLKEDMTVILDATNTTLKSRRAIFDNLKIDCDVDCYVMNTPYETCVKNVEFRNLEGKEHYVPLEALERYYKSFQIPTESEGFNSIMFDEYRDFDIDAYNQLINSMIGFNQNNKHHTKDLYGHSYTAGASYGSEVVGLLHDVGKLFCKTVDENGESHYYNHANIGAYYLMCHPELIPYPYRSMVLNITNYHMLPYNWQTQKTHDKYKKLLGEELYKELLNFHKADEEAH